MISSPVYRVVRERNSRGTGCIFRKRKISTRKYAPLIFFPLLRLPGVSAAPDIVRKEKCVAACDIIPVYHILGICRKVKQAIHEVGILVYTIVPNECLKVFFDF